tara:strand:+ start:256 stop:492 length:237 start_codon:yes stop_codon:yes gene_type:complete
MQCCKRGENDQSIGLPASIQRPPTDVASQRLCEQNSRNQRQALGPSTYFLNADVLALPTAQAVDDCGLRTFFSFQPVE